MVLSFSNSSVFKLFSVHTKTQTALSYTAVSSKIVQQVPYATMPKGILGNGGSWSLIEALGVSAT